MSLPAVRSAVAFLAGLAVGFVAGRREPETHGRPLGPAQQREADSIYAAVYGVDPTTGAPLR